MDDEMALGERSSEGRGQSLSGAEPFLTGLAPGYWSHVPMSIADIIHGMKNVDGVNCRVVYQQHQDKNQQKKKLIKNVYPVSKCTILGTIIYAESRAANNIYVLDDGSGLIDCVSWSDGDGIYALPSLVADNAGNKQEGVSVGDLVRVTGRMECVSISETKQDLRLDEKVVELRDCIHEIHVRLIEPIPFLSSNASALDLEANHWVLSIHRTRPASSAHPDGLKNGLDVLDLLGPNITKDAENRRNFPSADDTLGAWRVFGVSCRCTLRYKDALLYCHCQAKPEPLDKAFMYRDNLLNTLMDMEQNQSRDLRFQYRTIANDERLSAIAAQVAAPTENANRNNNAKELVIATFRALSDDGIIHLLDQVSDTYLLNSRQYVLEPYIQRSLTRKQRNLPIYLQNVPNTRLQYIKRCIYSEVEST